MPDPRLLTEEALARMEARTELALRGMQADLGPTAVLSLFDHIAALSEQRDEAVTENERLRDVLEQIGYGSEARENASLTRRQIENIARAALAPDHAATGPAPEGEAG